MSVALVTDSTACLPEALLERVGALVDVVPLQVGIDEKSLTEGVDVVPQEVAAALEQGRRVTTSRPAPARMLAAYEQARRAGADGVVSVHLSSSLSSTVSSAHLAAAESRIPVRVIDSTTLGMAMGFAVLDGAEAAAANAGLDEVAEVVRRTARTSATAIYVDSLEALKRGGRIGRAGALFGSALSIKPLLTLKEGVLEPLERVRTTSKAMDRLVRRTVESVAEAQKASSRVAVAVHSLSRRDLAETVLERVQDQCEQRVSEWWSAPLGAVVTAHVGAGTVATVVAAREGLPSEV